MISLKDYLLRCWYDIYYYIEKSESASKSMLIKIMSGVYQPDEGALLVEGKAVHLGTPHEAQGAGVSAVHQELNMQPYLSIAGNIFLSHQPYGRFGLIDSRQLRRMGTDLLQQLGIDLDPKQTLEELIVAQRETILLVAIIRRLKERRIGIVYISHRLEEITELVDRVTVLRDVHTAPIEQFSVDQIVSMMVGCDISDLFRKQAALSREYVDRLAIRTPSIDQHVKFLIGV
ncbi:MAG: sugar ABC transporter ATP-binding protein [Anaerolineae bacterium]|nr:sugar ABC transporter ATP-binding protein [Anaerolineae bacterium]